MQTGALGNWILVAVEKSETQPAHAEACAKVFVKEKSANKVIKIKDVFICRFGFRKRLLFVKKIVATSH